MKILKILISSLKARNHYFKLIVVLIFSCCLLTSCDTNKLELDISFNTPENEYKESINKFVENGVLFRDSTQYDIETFKKFNINNNIYKLRFSSNFIESPHSGPLRDYSYSLEIEKPNAFTNDTAKCIAENLYYDGENVISKENFEYIKKYLESKYGKYQERLESISESKFLNYDFQNEKFKVTLYRCLDDDKIIKDAFRKKLINKIFYKFCGIEFRSLDYEQILEKEKNIAISKLKPNDIMSFVFDEPYLTSDQFGGRINVPLTHYGHNSKLFQKSIIQCKGDLIISDLYGDLIKSEEFENVVFPAPIPPPPNVYTLFGMTFKFSGYGFENNKIRNFIKNKNKLKVEFKVKAIVFDDGSVFK